MTTITPVSSCNIPYDLDINEQPQKEQQTEVKRENGNDGTAFNLLCDEVESFIHNLQTQQNKPRGDIDAQQEELARLTLKVNARLKSVQGIARQTGDDLAHQEAKVVQALLMRLKEAGSVLNEPKNGVINIRASALPIVLKQALLGTSTVTPLQVDPRREPVQSPEATSLEAPVQSRKVPPAPSREGTSKAVPPGDDITTIGQDKMTPEEKFWHSISLFLAKLKEIDNEIYEIYMLTWPGSVRPIPKEEILKKLNEIREFFKALESEGLPLPDGLDLNDAEELLKSAGVPYKKENGVLKPAIPDVLSIMDWAIKNCNNNDFRSLNGNMYSINQRLAKIGNDINNYYPTSDMPDNHNNGFTGWLDEMIPPFESIDKINMNLYKSLIALTQAWQEKLNDFSERFGNLLGESDGPNKDTQKHTFKMKLVNEMMTVLKEIDTLKEQAALILGNVSEEDINKLLEGTGIKLTSKGKVGTVAIVNMGDDLTKMLNSALDACFNPDKNAGKDNCEVTAEQLTQFQKTLEEAKAQFNSNTKKVATKSDHTSSVFKSTQEALSNLLSQMITMISDLFRNLR